MKQFALILMLLILAPAWGQDLTFVFRGQIENQDLGKKEGGVKIAFVQNGSTIATAQTSSNGKYTLRAKANYSQPFQIVFSKPGLVNKKVFFNLNGLNEEDLPAGDEYRPVESLDMTMFKERDNVDFSFLNTEPVADFTWNTRKLTPAYDQVASNKIRVKIEKLLIDSEKKKTEAEAKYNEAIAAADAAANSKEYERAIQKYEEALSYKPKEKYPADRILELDALVQSQQEAALAEEQANAKYNNLIEAADNLRDGGELEKAVAKYQEALAEKNEQYPKDQISTLNAQIVAIAKEKENQAKYDAAIQAADGFMGQNSLRAAKDKYKEASKLKPSEQYPKDKLAEIEGKLAAQAELEAKQKKYDDAVEAADKLYDAKDFEQAKAKYQEALSFESSATYPKDRIKMCDEEIAKAKEAEALEQQIADLMKQGDDAVSSKSYDQAKTAYEGVLSIASDNSEAQTKLADVERLIEEQAAAAAQDEQFNSLVEAGDLADSRNDYQEALTNYQEALNIKQDATVSNKIKDVQAKLDAANAEAAKKEEYDRLMAEAGGKMAADQLEDAKALYLQAKGVDPLQTEPDVKIREIDALIADQTAQQQKEEEFNRLMEEGETAITSKNYEVAIGKFEAAAGVDPTKTEPAARIQEIRDMLAEQEAEAEKKAQYEEAITAADNLFDSSDLEGAKKKYEEAASIDGSQSKPVERIAEIDRLLADKAAAEEKQRQIASLITEGTQLMARDDLDGAKGKFEEVLSIDPTNVEASTKIDDINKQLAALKGEAEKEEAFNRLKEEGFSLFDSEDYIGAKQKLNEALTLKEDNEVRSKLVAIEDAIKANLADQELQKRYDDAIADAQTKEGANNLQGAIEVYKEAKRIKPGESLPDEKIAELTDRLNNMAADAEAEAQKEEDYQKALKRGKELMGDENYLDAIQEFNNALAIKPSSQEPKDLAAEAERLEREKGDADKQYEKILTVAQKKIDGADYTRATELLNRAKGLKPGDPRPDQMLAQVAELKKRENEYKSLMASAESKATAKDYKGAIRLFEDAQRVKPEETLPSERIEEMNRLLDGASDMAEQDRLYRDYMQKGSATEIGKKYEEALSHYQNALSVKPGDAKAQDKIDEMQQILDDLANAKADDLKRKNDFDKLIAQADQEFAAENWVPQAKELYEEALALYPGSAYAITQRDECVRLARNKGADEANAQYQKLLRVADEKFDAASYDKAKELYTRAVGIRSSDPYPKEKLKEIESILNPVVVEQEGLEDLGDPFDGSILDGTFVLEQAEEERELSSGLVIDAELDKIKDDNVEMTAEKTREREQVIQDIYELQQLIRVSTKDSDDKRLELIEKLNAAKLELKNLERGNSDFEYAENIQSQGTLYVVREEVALDYSEDEAVYRENTEIIDKTQDELSEVTTAITEDYEAISLESDGKLFDIHTKVREDRISDYDERVETHDIVFDAEEASFQATKANADENYDEVLGQRDQLEDVRAKVKTKHEEDTGIAHDNNDEVKIVRAEVIDKIEYQHDMEERQAFKLDGEIADVERKVIDYGLDERKNLRVSTEVFKDIADKHEEAEYIAYQQEMEKYMRHKDILSTEEERREDIVKVAKEAEGDKIAYVEGMEEKSREATSQGAQNDELERLNARKSVEAHAMSQETKTNTEKDRTQKSNQAYFDMEKSVTASNENKVQAESTKAQENQGKLDDVDTSIKPKKKIANSLGEEYPEGVTEENFTRKDNKGLVTTLITRRIVVIDGHADVYVRTQTSTGVTYTKNDKPSLAHVWNKETQGPDLVRH